MRYSNKKLKPSEPRGIVYGLASMGVPQAISALQQSSLPYRADWAEQAQTNYQKYKERGTPSSAIRTPVPKLYL